MKVGAQSAILFFSRDITNTLVTAAATAVGGDLPSFDSRQRVGSGQIATCTPNNTEGRALFLG